MNVINCVYCGQEIHPLRLEALPQTKTCMGCSKEGKKAAKVLHRVDKEDVESFLEFYSEEEYRRILEIEKKGKNGKS